MSMKKIIQWAVIIFIAYYIFTSPAPAAHAGYALFTGIKAAAANLATFLSSL
jgi:hypothetical protein